MKKLICFAFCLGLLAVLSCAAAESAVSLPKNLRSVGDEAFYGDTSLYDVVLPDSVSYIGQRAFAFSSVKHINLPAGITFIAGDAFEGCDLEYACAAGDYCKEYCEDHGINIKDDPNEGDPYTGF